MCVGGGGGGAVLSATEKGALDMSVRISSFFAFVGQPLSLPASAELCTRIRFP